MPLNARWAMVFLLFGLVVYAVGCGKPSEKSSSPERKKAMTAPQPKPSPRFRVETIGVKELSWQANGRYIMRARASNLKADEATGIATLERAEAILYRNGKEAASFKANHIRADVNAGTLSATSCVEVRSLLRNARAQAGSVVWHNRQGKISGSGGVSVQSDAGEMVGDRLEADTALHRIILTSATGGRASINAAALERIQ